MDRGPGSRTTRGQAQRSPLRTPGPCRCPHSPKGRSPRVPTLWAVRAYWTPPRHHVSVPKGSGNPLRLPRPQQRPWWTVAPPLTPGRVPAAKPQGPTSAQRTQPPSSLTCHPPPPARGPSGFPPCTSPTPWPSRFMPVLTPRGGGPTAAIRASVPLSLVRPHGARGPGATAHTLTQGHTRVHTHAHVHTGAYVTAHELLNTHTALTPVCTHTHSQLCTLLHAPTH